MVKYNPKTWLDLIFHSYSRQVLRVLTPALIVIILYTSAICWVIIEYFEDNFHSTTAFHGLLGIVLGLILVFRMNSAYDRWWEGRKQWGALVNNTRNLAFKLMAFIPEDQKEEREYFKKMIPNFVYAFKEHLRDGVIEEEMDAPDPEFLKAMGKVEHKPNYISTELYKRVNQMYKKGWISGDHFFMLDKELKSFSDILGACERIRNTPIPYSYSMYIKKFIFTYTVTLPFGFVTEFSYYTIPVVALLFFILVSIELISEEIEEPFGRDVNDLPTDGLSEKIKGNVSEVLG